MKTMKTEDAWMGGVGVKMTKLGAVQVGLDPQCGDKGSTRAAGTASDMKMAQALRLYLPGRFPYKNPPRNAPATAAKARLVRQR